MAHKPKLLADGFLFPETPRWHKRRGRFLISDIDRGQIIELALDGQRRVLYQAPFWVSGTAFADDETLMVTHATDRALVRVNLESATATPFARLEAVAQVGINDMIRTASGHYFVDTVDFDFAAYSRGEADAKSSVLARVAPDGSVSIATREVNFPNGMAIGPNGDALYVADSLDACIYAFPLAADGTLGPRSCFAELSGEMPDGISLDASGALWVATHHRVIRVAKGGEVLEEVDMGSTRATACMLGGPDGRTLLITASDSHDRSIITENPSGRVFKVEVDVPGAGLPSIY
ncbi:MAG: SMP-30/gluconolactonase/LRE family protein [Hyphomonadaceae bacterium]